ncbi:MAG: hypothetical protein JXA95_03200 [Spirochaetales bacterium]|nr:hypothetical protein [Spirochaetales bacterium]
MKIRKMSLRTKLIISFLSIIIMAAVIGLIGYSSINKINDLNEGGQLINTALVDTQDVQAASLRYVIYGDESYQADMKTEVQNVYTNAAEAKEHMANEADKLLVDELIRAMEKYDASNNRYYQLALDKIKAEERRAEAAGITQAGITDLFDQEISAQVRNQGMDTEYYRAVSVAQELRNSYNRVRIWAGKYKSAVKAEDQDSIAKSWVEEITLSQELNQQCLNLFVLPSTLAGLREVHDALDNYAEEVETFRQINRDQREEQAVMRDEAANTLDAGRQVRDAMNVEIAKTTNQAIILILTLLGAAIITGLTISLMLTNNIMKSLGSEPDEIANIAEEIASGNLTLEFDDRKAVGVYKSMKNMTANLSSTMSDIRNASDQVSSGSGQISQSSQQISSGATEQASSTEEISSSMEELVSNIQQNTENAQKADEIARKAAEDASLGGESVNDTVLAMRSISEKIGIIEDIARNTNMLALNAAIEAARAGEAGKGFAVVASEVRKLAENSGKAAADITDISANSVKAAEQAGLIINNLVPQIQETAELVQEITMASEEQTRGAEQINTSIQQLDTVIQQNASASEELASMSEELNSQSEMMTNSIAFFKLSRHRENIGQKKLPRTSVSHSEAVVPDRGTPETPLITNEKKPAPALQDDEFEEF